MTEYSGEAGQPIAIFRAPQGLPIENPVFRLRIFRHSEEQVSERIETPGGTKWHGRPFFASGLRPLLVHFFGRAKKMNR
jgi:hypothetical protein